MAIGLPLQNTGLVEVDIKALRSTQTPFQIRGVDGTVLFKVIADGTVSGAQLGLPQTATVVLTAAQILDLADTPVSLVAAPGAGKILRFHGATLLLNHSGTGFAENADNLTINYDAEAGVVASQTIECTGFIDQTADTVTTAEPKINALGTAAGMVNKALVLVNPNDDFTDAGTTTSTLIVKTVYSVHASGL